MNYFIMNNHHLLCTWEIPCLAIDLSATNFHNFYHGGESQLLVADTGHWITIKKNHFFELAEVAICVGLKVSLRINFSPRFGL